MLSCYRILDLSTEKGYFCGRVLGDLGADVIKIEPPGGDPGRNRGPFYQDKPEAEKSLYWMAFNANKKGITLDIATADGREVFKRLAAKADAVIESFDPGYMQKIGLGYDVLSQINPGLVMTSISAFGQEGPYRDYKASDLVVRALGGLIYTVGEADRPPVTTSYFHSYLVGAVHAAMGTMTALYARAFSGKGQQVDAPTQLGLAFIGNVEQQVPWILKQNIPQRQGRNRFATQMKDGNLYYQPILWKCKDGDIAFSLATAAMASSHKHIIEGMKKDGIDTAALDKWDWTKPHDGEWNREELDAVIGALKQYFVLHTKAELMQMALEKGVHFGISLNVGEALKFPQFVARDFWTQIDHPELGAKLTYPGGFVKFSDAECGIKFRAPLIGEHNKEIYAKELGLSQDDLVILKQSGVI
jgi:crotonobetainyl-CoA:carnitine CoA-transferase CaiB-like acyl-CoA transferase